MPVPDPAPLRLLLVDDHVLVREGVGLMLAAHQDFAVVGEADDADEAISLARELRPDVVLIEMALPEGGGIRAIRQIAREMPDVAVVVLTRSDDPKAMIDAIAAGAQGFISKHVRTAELVAGLRGLARGEAPLSGHLAAQLLAAARSRGPSPPVESPLTDRERQIVELVAGRASNKAIGEKLGISQFTVRNHLRRICAKLHVDRREDAVAYCVERGWITAAGDSPVQSPGAPAAASDADQRAPTPLEAPLPAGSHRGHDRASG